MPTILFGTEPNPVRVSEGEFFCPHCMQVRAYHRTIVQRRLRAPGMRLPIGAYGEYVECRTCLATYRPEVLAYDAGTQTPMVSVEYQKTLRRILALMVAADGVVREAEVVTVQRIYESVCGVNLSRDEVVAEIEAVGQQPTTAARYLAKVVGFLNQYGKEQVLRGAALVSRADGSVHPSERNIVERLGAVMRLPSERVELIMRVR